MKIFLLVLFCCAACAATAQTQVYPVQAPIVRHVQGNPANVVTYMNLDTAITAASDGDVYYLAGNYSTAAAAIGTSNGTVLNKKIIVYGTGYREDTSLAMKPTKILGNFYLGANSKGSSFYGIDFQGAIGLRGNVIESIFFDRCKIIELSLTGMTEPLSYSLSVNLKDCIVGNILDMGASGGGIVPYGNIIAQNCIFIHTLFSAWSSRQFSANNCIFLGNVTPVIQGFGVTNISNSIIFLNVPSGNLLSGGTPSGITNCLIIGEANRLGSISTTVNIRKDITFKDDVFVNRTDLFAETANFNLKNTLQSALNNDLIYNKLGIYRNPDGSEHLSFGKATPPVHVARRELRFSVDGRSLIFTGKVVDGN